MVRHYITAAFKVGPLSMLIFLLGVEFMDTSPLRIDDFLMFFIVGTFITTLLAIVASFLVYGSFELFQKHYALRLKAHALFHYFLPVLLFGFGSMLAATLLLSNDAFTISLAISTYLSAVLGWSFYCRSKARMEQALLSYPLTFKHS